MKVFKFLTIEEAAAKYGQKLNCILCSPSGDEWGKKKIKVDAQFLKEMENGTIQEVHD